MKIVSVRNEEVLQDNIINSSYKNMKEEWRTNLLAKSIIDVSSAGFTSTNSTSAGEGHQLVSRVRVVLTHRWHLTCQRTFSQPYEAFNQTKLTM